MILQFGIFNEHHPVRPIFELIGHLTGVVREEKSHGKTRTTDRFYGEESRRFDGNHQKHTAGAFCGKCSAWRGSLGLEPTPELYVEHIVEVFREVRRVLRKDGSLWLNMGDCYTGSANSGSSTPRGGGGKPHRIQGLPTKSGGSLKPKDLLGMPWRVAFALQADGWWLRSDVIWSKPNPMPESTRDRPTRAHEYLFLFTKSGSSVFWTHRDHAGVRSQPKPDYRWIDQAAAYLYAHRARLWGTRITETFKALGFNANLSAAERLIEHKTEPPDWRTEPFPKVPEGWPQTALERRWKRINLWRGHDYYYDADAIREPHKPESLARYEYGLRASYAKKDSYGGTKDNAFCATDRPGDYINEGSRNKRSVWTIATQSFPGAHFATFPEKLIEPCIKAGTSEYGCCPKCKAPYERKVERERFGKATSGTKFDNTMQGGPLSRSRQAYRAAGLEGPPPSKTIGWNPTCACGKSALDTCIILDPFCGSGTAGVVALKLGRSFIGTELNPDYCKMARRRIGQAAPLFAKEKKT